MHSEFRKDIVEYYIYQEIMDSIIIDFNNLSINN